jgi:hypothetical protein
MAISKNSLKRLKPKSLSICWGSPPPSTKLATTMLLSYGSLANVNQNRNNRVSGMKRGHRESLLCLRGLESVPLCVKNPCKWTYLLAFSSSCCQQFVIYTFISLYIFQTILNYHILYIITILDRELNMLAVIGWLDIFDMNLEVN